MRVGVFRHCCECGYAAIMASQASGFTAHAGMRSWRGFGSDFGGCGCASFERSSSLTATNLTGKAETTRSGRPPTASARSRCRGTPEICIRGLFAGC